MVKDSQKEYKFQLSRHPSEGDEYFTTRILAYIFHYKKGITAHGQVCQGERPALAVMAPDQWHILEWIEMGLSSEKKLRLASRQSEKVFVDLYKHQTSSIPTVY